MDEKTTTPIRLLSRKQLEEKLCLAKSAIYARLDQRHPSYDETFPKPIDLGGGKNPPIRWIEQEVDEWIYEQIKRRT